MSAPLRTHKFTVDDYHRMAEAGFFQEDDRVELIDGQVVRVTPIGPEHAGCVDYLARLFTEFAGNAWIVRVQNPVVLGKHAEPEPDIAVLRPRPRGYRTRHPGPDDIMLVPGRCSTAPGAGRSSPAPASRTKTGP